MKLIVQAVAADENHTVELYRRGVRGIISRSISPDLLVSCVRRIAAGETWIDNQSVNWVIEAYRSQAASLVSPRNQPRLSPKEMAIITCITQGKRNKEIAFQLGTTEQVIKNYLRKIYDKLGVSDRLELALYCLHNKIIQADVDEEVTGEKGSGELAVRGPHDTGRISAGLSFHFEFNLPCFERARVTASPRRATSSSRISSVNSACSCAPATRAEPFRSPDPSPSNSSSPDFEI